MHYKKFATPKMATISSYFHHKTVFSSIFYVCKVVAKEMPQKISCGNIYIYTWSQILKPNAVVNVVANACYVGCKNYRGYAIRSFTNQLRGVVAKLKLKPQTSKCNSDN